MRNDCGSQHPTDDNCGCNIQLMTPCYNLLCFIQKSQARNPFNGAAATACLLRDNTIFGYKNLSLSMQASSCLIFLRGRLRAAMQKEPPAQLFAAV